MGERLVERFCEMVRIDSESGNEARFIDAMRQRLEHELGATCATDDYGNLVAKVPAIGEHTDTGLQPISRISAPITELLRTPNRRTAARL